MISQSILFACFKSISGPSNKVYFKASAPRTYIIASGTAINAVSPTGATNNDLLLAFVMNRSNLTVPTGWTLVASVDCMGSNVSQRLSVLRKNIVTSSDSGATFTFIQSASGRMNVNFLLFGSTTSIYNIININSNAVNDITTFSITPNTLTATSGEVVISVSNTILASSTSDAPVITVQPNFTLTSGTLIDTRIAVSYFEATSEFTTSGNVSLANIAAASPNGLANIIFRISPS